MTSSFFTYETLQAPPEETEIKADWLPELGCQVSVCMLVYNHAPYIKDALNSILNQKTNFAFEILVHDDASQDNSQVILREYEKRYPNIIKPIYQSINQHSQKINPSVHYNYPRANSPFITICEGDDFWTDKKKLQSQVDLFNKNPKINLSFHQAYEINLINLGTQPLIIGDYAKEQSLISFTDVLFRTRGMIPTASCMIRNEEKEKLRTFMHDRPYLTIGDLFFQFFGAYPNGAIYINKPMSAYRLGTEHSWTWNVLRDFTYKTRHERAMLLAYSEINKLTKKTFYEKLSILTLQRLLWLFNPGLTDNKNTLKSSVLDKTTLSEKKIIENDIYFLYEKYIKCQKLITDTLKKCHDIKNTKVIYGAGSDCKLILDTLGAFSIKAIIDRDDRRSGQTVNTVPIINSKQLKKIPGAHLLVSVSSADKKSLNKLAHDSSIPLENIHYIFDSAVEWLMENPVTAEKLR